MTFETVSVGSIWPELNRIKRLLCFSNMLSHIQALLEPGGLLMDRRKFLGLFGVVAAPFAAKAQPMAVPVIGFLHSGSQRPQERNIAAFHRGLAEIGFAAGKNVTIEYRWADGEFDRLPALANDLVARRVAALAAFAPPTVVAAKSATATTPIVFAMGADPVRLRLVNSLNRPGGNITGVTFLTVELVAKRLELLRALMPKAAAVGFLVNPSNPTADIQIKSVQDAAASLGLQVNVARAHSETEIDDAFAALALTHPNGLVVGADSFFISRRDRLVALAARYALPAIYENREAVLAGGLISYAPSFEEAFYLVGRYIGRILKGEKPSELPVVQPTRFELLINAKTAKSLGLSVPPTLLARADQVIE